MANLLDGQTSNANGDKAPLAYPSSPPYGTDVYYTVYVWGTFNGATVSIEVSPDEGTTWFDVPGLDYTSKDVRNLEVSGTHVRAVVSSAGGSTDLNATIL